MPRISEFYGIVMAMYFREHGVPHFHATYAGETVVVAIETGEVIVRLKLGPRPKGTLPCCASTAP